jgi:hypothetical protein
MGDARIGRKEGKKGKMGFFQPAQGERGALE